MAGRSTTEESVYNKTTLSNGIRVVSESIPYVRSISVGVWADVGSRDESPRMNGISHFLEHMVFKGTKRRSVREIARSLERVGGYLNAFTTKEQTCFYARALDTHLSTTLDVLSDIVLNATFDARELEKERLVVIEELKNAEDNPEEIIHDYFEKMLFPTHTLGSPIIGTTQNLMRFSRKDLQDHVARHYRPEHLVIAAAGNINHDELVRLSEKHFSSLKGSKNSWDRVLAPVRAKSSAFQEYERPIQQSHVCLGTISYGLKHRDRHNLQVLNSLLGEGMSSRLYQNIRERHGFAYAVYSYVSLLSDTGVFRAYVGTDKKNTERSIELIRKELFKLRDREVSRAELERTKSQIKGNLLLGLESMSGRMMRLGSNELCFQTFISLDSVLQKIDRASTEGIQRVARDLFREGTLSTIIIKPDGGSTSRISYN